MKNIPLYTFAGLYGSIRRSTYTQKMVAEIVVYILYRKSRYKLSLRIHRLVQLHLQS